jgi:hypothetical protein
MENAKSSQEIAHYAQERDELVKTGPGSFEKISSARCGDAVSAEPDASDVSTTGVFGSSTKRCLDYAASKAV